MRRIRKPKRSPTIADRLRRIRPDLVPIYWSAARAAAADALKESKDLVFVSSQMVGNAVGGIVGKAVGCCGAQAKKFVPRNITISSKAMFLSIFFSVFLLSGAAFGFLVWCETDTLREAMVLKSERMREIATDECFSPTLTLMKRIGENLNAGK